jgi:hypothetical protein
MKAYQLIWSFVSPVGLMKHRTGMVYKDKPLLNESFVKEIKSGAAEIAEIEIPDNSVWAKILETQPSVFI